MLRIAVVGYGNIGKYAVEAINAAPDMELAGVVARRNLDKISKEIPDVKVTTDIKELGKVDTALICAPTRSVAELAKKYLVMGINTVDSYDIHSSICELRAELDKTAKEHGAVSIISAGWDPGSDSIVRTLMEACMPKGITYTNFGPGMSMGHSVAAKSKSGVKDALSITIPLGTGIHRRMVYVELEEGADITLVEKEIKADPYFSHDETHVTQVKNLSDYIDMGHGVYMVRKGVSGLTHNQVFEFNMSINNPALTSQVMTACARAASKQAAGAYTMIEIPVIDLLYGERDLLIKKLV